MRRVAVLTGLLIVALVMPVLASAQAPNVNVEELAEDVYLFTYNTHRSLFVIGGDSVLATDPQSPEAAARYVEEIRKITDKPIAVLVYSHHHADHVSGGDAFPDETLVVAHGAARDAIEADDGIRNADRYIAGGSWEWDGVDVEFRYPGPSETDSNLILFIPQRRVAFMVDAVAVRTVPWRNMASGDARQWKAALEYMAELDFDILAPGHGPTGIKQHVVETIEYLDTLINAVQERIDRGESLEQIQATLELPQYADWVRYDQHFELNIEGVYRSLTSR